MRHSMSSPGRRRALIAGAGASMLACLVAVATGAAPASALPGGCAQAVTTVTCTYTSGTNTFTVPKGVASVHVVAIGGTGGAAVGTSQPPGSSGGAGGPGARVEGDLSVSSGTTLYAVVGGNGIAGFGGISGNGGANGGANGNSCDLAGAGGGGGASDVRTSPSDPSTRMIVAGGGGGGGCGGRSFGTEGNGGAGGTADAPGDPGADVLSTAHTYTSHGGGGGGAGTASAGGAGGAGGAIAGLSDGGTDDPGCTGGEGVLAAGGFGSFLFDEACGAGGGGGGGGLYGGGGGGGPSIEFAAGGGAGGGGGGSSLVPAGGTESIDATATPEITISYTVPDTVSPAAVDFGSQALGSTSASKTVTFSDTGSASIALGSASLGGANPGDFTITSDGCSNTTIAPSGSCAVNVAFAPTATGARGATLSFDDDAYDSPQTATLTGTGTTLADVKLAIGGPSSAPSGSQDTYTLTVSNAGPSTAASVGLTTQVPSGTKFVSVKMTGGTCTAPKAGSSTGTISCSLGDLAAKAAAIDTLTLKMTLISKGGSVSLAAHAASASTPDPDLSNNVASFSTTISKR